jgi:DNA-binding transcriptional regulator YdaS (Cro superfamily)
MNILEQIFEHFGSKRALASKLEVTPQSLTRWKTFGVPANAAIEIEKLTDGKFKAVDIPLYSQHKNAA